MARVFVALISSLLCCQAAFSTQLIAEQYNTSEGLSQSTVVSLAEDQYGFLWVGTQEGLHRFDGHRFDLIKSGPDSAVVSPTMDVLRVDQSNRLWMGSNESGVQTIDLANLEGEDFGTERGLSHPRVIDLFEDRVRQRFLVTTAAGVDALSVRSGQATSLLRRSDLIASLVDDAGQWWAADRYCRLWREGELFEIAMAPSRCVALLHDAGQLWLVTAAADLWRIDGQASEYIGAPAEFTQRVSSALLQQDGSLMLGTDAGTLAKYSPTTGWQAQHMQLANSAVTELFRNRAGVLWVGTFAEGLFRVQPLSEQLLVPEFRDQQTFEAWPSSIVWSLLKDEQGWLVGTQQGLMVDQGGGQWQHVPALDGIAIRSMVKDRRQGGVWLGTQQGLWWWQSPSPPRQVVAGQLPDARITDLVLLGGELWIATRGGLAVAFDGELLPERIPEPLRHRFISTLAVEGGTIWAGTNEDGVYRVLPDGESEQFFAGNAAEQTRSIWSILPRQGDLFLGTFGGGMLRLDGSGQVKQRFTRDQGLPNDVVYRILPDTNGRLWLSTNRGLAAVDIDTGVVQQVTQADGLNNREFNAGAAAEGKGGRLFFGGLDGVDGLQADALPEQSPPAYPVFSRLTIGHRHVGVFEPFDGLDLALPEAQRLVLSPQQGVFALQIVALSFHAPQAARLRYRLEGLDNQWRTPAGPSTEFSINYLSPGEYSLVIEAAGRDGRFGQRRSLTLVLQPPLWRHPLAYLGYALTALLLLLLMAWRLRVAVRRKREQVDELNRLVEARTSELSELNTQLAASNRQLDLATRRDPLTGISNRRDFHAWMEALKVGSGRDRSLLFIMIDVDDFKLVNDHHGHGVGDEVLVEFAARLRRFSREQDLLVRWGGEEFLLVMQAHSADHAPELLRRIIDAVSQTPLALANGVSLPISCSVGAAAWPFFSDLDKPQPWELTVQMADRALYAAKEAGKNGWVLLRPGADVSDEAKLHDWTLHSLEHLSGVGLLELEQGRASI